VKRVTLCLVVGWLLVGLTVGATTIVSTHAVLGEFAQQVGGEVVEVVTIIPSGFCPAQYDLSPSDLTAVLDASVILYSGFEPWIETLADAAGSKAVVLQLPGEWNTPHTATAKVEAIRDLFVERFPEHADQFATNARTYIEELQQLGDRLLDLAESAGVGDVAVVCMEWQTEFVAWLGFDIAERYGIPAKLSIRDLIDLADAGRGAGAQLVIDNLQSGVNFGAKLAREIGAVHVTLSNFPGAMPSTATVLDLLLRNAEALCSAIEPLTQED